MSDSTASSPSPLDDEPKTPMWLPALGAALFVGAGLYWAVQPAAPPPADSAAVASASAPPQAPAPTAPAPQPRPSFPQAQPQQAPTQGAAGNAGAKPPVMNLPPDLQQRVKGQRGAPHP